MQKCDFEKYLIEYINGDLTKSKYSELTEHLTHCSICSDQLDNFEPFHVMLLKRQRPNPPERIQKRYQNYLAVNFKSGARIRVISDYFWNLIFGSESRLIRLAQVVALIFIGVILGRIFFYPSANSKHKMESTNFERNLSEGDLKLITTFLLESEMLLLEITNGEPNELSQNFEFSLDRELAKKLLMKTFLIHEKALQIQSQQVLNFLSQLELILYEIANSDEEEGIDLLEIKQFIHQQKLLEVTRRIKSSFENLKSIHSA